MTTYSLALVGATGLVGQEILRVLEERDFPVGSLALLASMRSEGSRLEFRGRSHVVRLVSHEALRDADLAIFAAGTEVSKDYAPQALEAGAMVIDLSAAFRHHADTLLCLHSLNATALRRHRGMVALPHSLTAQVALVLAPLHAAAGLKRVVISSYQSASGQGRRGVQEFDQQLRDLLNFRPPQVQTFPHQIAFNCLPQCGAFLEEGYTEDEMALIRELPCLLASPQLPVTATAVQVPMAHGYAAAVTIETSKPLAAAEARALLEQAIGVEVEDDHQRLYYPLVTRANGQDAVFVGRLRRDLSVPNGLHLWVVADNLRQGAALNAVDIATSLIEIQRSEAVPGAPR